MHFQLKRGAVLFAFVCLASPSFSQSTLRAERITSTVKDAGIFRVATGTWDRSPSTALSIGSLVLFNNNAPSGYYYAGQSGDTLVGEGRIPALGSGGSSNDYLVNCWQVAYCTDIPGPTIGAAAEWFEQYASCEDPAVSGGPFGGPAVSIGTSTVTGLPGSPGTGTQSCWTVTIDMSLTTDQFILPGDGDHILSGLQEQDSFGWSTTISFTGSNSTGPLIAGDPLNAPFGAGTNPAWGFAPGPEGTGLDELDQFYAAGGCAWYGGYPNNNIWGGHWHQLLGADTGGIGTNYCTSAVNSTGVASTMLVMGSASLGANDLVLMADDLPSQPGIFIAGPVQANTPLYCSVMCIDPSGLQWFSDTSAPSPGGLIIETVDYATSAPGGLNVMAGSTMNYQRWNRDPMGTANCQPGVPNNTATFSDAYAITHTP